MQFDNTELVRAELGAISAWVATCYNLLDKAPSVEDALVLRAIHNFSAALAPHLEKMAALSPAPETD
jgi:hypothetical protein